MTLSIPESSPSCREEGLQKDAQDLGEKSGESIVDFADACVVLKSESFLKSFLSLQVFMHYPFEREVQPALKKNVFQTRTFGMKLRSALSKDICCTDLIRYTFIIANIACRDMFSLTGSKMTVDELMANQTRIER